MMRTWTHEERIGLVVERITIKARGRHVAGQDAATIRQELRDDLRKLVWILPGTETPEMMAESIVARGQKAIEDAIATPPTEAELARYHAALAKGGDPEDVRVCGYLDAEGYARLVGLHLRLAEIAQEQAEEFRALAAKKGFVIPGDDQDDVD
jgi:hypothetical protein